LNELVVKVNKLLGESFYYKKHIPFTHPTKDLDGVLESTQELITALKVYYNRITKISNKKIGKGERSQRKGKRSRSKETSP